MQNRVYNPTSFIEKRGSSDLTGLVSGGQLPDGGCWAVEYMQVTRKTLIGRFM